MNSHEKLTKSTKTTKCLAHKLAIGKGMLGTKRQPNTDVTNEKISHKGMLTRMLAPCSVYLHISSNGIIFYVGMTADPRRPYNRSLRTARWKEVADADPEYSVLIISTGLSREDAKSLEHSLIKSIGREKTGRSLVNKYV